MLWTPLAIACMPMGASLVEIKHLGQRWLEEKFPHLAIAFGGRVLVSELLLS